MKMETEKPTIEDVLVIGALIFITAILIVAFISVMQGCKDGNQDACKTIDTMVEIGLD